MKAYIYDHVRTPRGKGRPDGALHDITAVELAAMPLKAIASRTGLDTVLIDDVILGCVQPVGEQSGVIARAAVRAAGYDQQVAGIQINRFCASGLDAVNYAASQVAVGAARAAIGGGVESMSRIPIAMIDAAAWVADPSQAYKGYFTPQGIAADLLATLDGHSREDLDGFALESQRRADEAYRNGAFNNAIIPVKDAIGRVVLDRDEHPRPNSTLEMLAGLKPAFVGLGASGYDAIAIQRYPQVEAIRHVHTGGNSSGIVDGAAAVLVGSADFGKGAGLRPRARVRAYASIGSEPTLMLTAPVDVTMKALAHAGMSIPDIDLFEINEAFASVVLHCIQRLGLDSERVNVAGGSIALGHPLGATGAMLVGTVLDELERRDLNTALITLCAANGLGTATIIERV